MRQSTPSTHSGFSVYLRLLQSTQPYWFIFLVGIVTTLLASSADAGIAWAVKPVVDKGLVARDPVFLFWLPFIVISVFCVRGVADFMSSYFITRVGRNVVMDFRQKIFSR